MLITPIRITSKSFPRHRLHYAATCAVAWRTLGRAGGGLIGAAAGAVVVKQLQEKRSQAASVMLHNLLASKADPGSLTREEVPCWHPLLPAHVA